MNKKSILSFLFISLTLFSWSQTLYVKLKQPLENTKTLQSKVAEEFAVQFQKHEIASNLLNSNVYKVKSSLNRQKATKLAEFLKQHQEVAYVSYHEEIPKLPNYTDPTTDIPPTTPDFLPNQGYLDEYPGVNAHYAWEQGADGTGIRIKNVEFGLNVDHEEFYYRNARIANNAVINSTLFSTGYYLYTYIEHGTATAGVVYSGNNDYGTKGIAYNADEFVLFPVWEEAAEADHVNAIANAIDDAEEGDVVIYELQMLSEYGQLVPIEYDPLVWDLTLAAHNKGVIVVAAAGNGNHSLDAPRYEDYMVRGDSKSIMVGMKIETPYQLLFSTHGTRVNLQAWGLNVSTTGYGGFFSPEYNQAYTDNYSGSSSATAIVGGCVAAIQSYYHNLTGEYLNSLEMSDLLVTTGVPQPQGETQIIGPVPDLKAAIERIDTMLRDANENNQDLIGLSFFPNPTSSQLNIRQVNIEPKEVQMYDSLGKLVYATTI